MAKNIEKLEPTPIISLADGEITAPAAALLTLFTQERSFGTKLLRQLIQSLAASLLQSGPLLGVTTRQLSEAYVVPTQVLLNCLKRWQTRGWVTAEAPAGRRGKAPERRGRNELRYALTPKGVVWLMTLVARCDAGVRHTRLDLMLASLLVARSFPLHMLSARQAGLDEHFGRPLGAGGSASAIEAADWDWKKIRDRFVGTLAVRAEDLQQVADELEPATSQIAAARRSIEKSGALDRLRTELEVKRRGRDNVFFWEGSEVSVPEEYDFYVPGLFAFGNQRDDRSIQDMGLLPLANFYKQFEPDFVRWHLFEGIERMRVGVYASYARYLRGVIEVLEGLR